MQISKPFVVHAKLTKNITYKKYGVELTVPKNTSILVDMDLMVALIGKDHVDIDDSEFRVLYQN